MGVIREASGISRLFAAAKLQSAPGADNPCMLHLNQTWNSSVFRKSRLLKQQEAQLLLG